MDKTPVDLPFGAFVLDSLSSTSADEPLLALSPGIMLALIQLNEGSIFSILMSFA
jgi:hypothetical protein